MAETNWKCASCHALSFSVAANIPCLHGEIEKLKAEIGILRPIVDAASKLRLADINTDDISHMLAYGELCDLVREYELRTTPENQP